MADLMVALRNAHNAGDTNSANRIAAMIRDQQAQQQETTIGEDIVGGLETAATLVSGAVAEPIAGIAGIAQSLNPFAEEGAGARAVEATREALTYQGGEASQDQLKSVGEVLAPVGKALSSAESFLGESVLDLTGSPALAAVAHSLPTAALELLGLKGAKRITGAPKAPSKRMIKKAIVESAPEVDQIKSAASAVYKEIDDSGVKVRDTAFKKLAFDIKKSTQKAGRDVDVTPRAEAAIRRFDKEIGEAKTLGEIDTVRKVAQGVANQLDPTEKALGNMMITEIDDFLDNLKPSDLVGGTQKAADTGKKFKAARKLWGRARRAELLNDAIKTGESRGAGAEAGIRNEFNRILNNKKLRKFIPKDEQAAMRAVVDGDFSQNMTKAIGKLGISIDRSPNILGGIVGTGGLSLVSGVGQGLIGPAGVIMGVGTASKEIAKRLTRNKAKFVAKMTQAGTDANKITKAYLTSVPKAKRSAQDLADLLSDPKINLDDLTMIANKTMEDAIDIAKGKRAINLASAALSGEINQGTTEQ